MSPRNEEVRSGQRAEKKIRPNSLYNQNFPLVGAAASSLALPPFLCAVLRHRCTPPGTNPLWPSLVTFSPAVWCVFSLFLFYFLTLLALCAGFRLSLPFAALRKHDTTTRRQSTVLFGRVWLQTKCGKTRDQLWVTLGVDSADQSVANSVNSASVTPELAQLCGNISSSRAAAWLMAQAGFVRLRTPARLIPPLPRCNEDAMMVRQFFFLYFVSDARHSLHGLMSPPSA